MELWEGREFEAWLHHQTTENSLSTQLKRVPCFESGKDMAAKGEEYAASFICCAQDTVKSNPHCPYDYEAVGNLYMFLPL